MGRAEDLYQELNEKSLKVSHEGLNHLYNLNYKKARECVDQIDKYETEMSNLGAYNIMVEENDVGDTLRNTLIRCEYLQYLLKTIYEAIEADDVANAQKLCEQFCQWFQTYQRCEQYPLIHTMSDKFRKDIINAKRFVEQNKNNGFAKQKLKEAKESAKNKKFDEALNLLAVADTYAGNDKIMNLISDERLKIGKDLQREREAEEIKVSNRNANESLRLAIDCKKNLQFQAAITNCERAASFARDETLKKKIQSEKRDLLQRAYNSYINEAEALVKENKCEAAYAKFDEASRMAKDPLLDSKYLTDLEAKINSTCNARAQYLQKIANDFVKENKANEAKEKFQEALCFARDNLIRTSIIADRDKEIARVENNNKQAMQFLQLGQGQVIKNEFKLAEINFDYALKFVADDALKKKIETEKAGANSKHVKYLQNEANDLLSRNKFKESIDKFEEAVLIVKDDSLKKSVEADRSKAVNQYVKILIDQANELVKQNKFAQAYDIFETALNVKGGTSNTARICKEQAKALNQEGMIYLKEAFKLESSEPITETKWQEAEKKLNRAKELFTKAEDASETKQKKNIQIAESKINGNKCFNDALLTEEEAFRFYENAKKYNKLTYFTSAQEKYQKAKELFEEAKKYFTTGLKLGCEEFRASINLASDQVSNIPSIITSINMLKLKFNDTKLDKELEKFKHEL